MEFMNVPPVIRIEPAASCNLRCRHCPTGLDQSPKGLMSIELFSKLLSQISPFIEEINTVVLYHGGEPLLNPDIVYFIETLKASGVRKVKIVTNGKLLNSKIQTELLMSGLDELEISLDGLSGTDSDLIRVRSNSSEILESISNLLKSRKEMSSALKVTVSTTQFLDDYVDDHSKIPNAPKPEWLVSTFEDELEIKSTWAVQWPGGHPDDSQVKFHDVKVTRPSRCSLLDETVTIRANGDVVVCCYDLTSLTVMGNVQDTNLIEILGSPKYKEFKQQFIKGIYSEPCISCSVVTGPRYLSKKNLLAVVQ